ncbi:hypothetical protein SAMN02799620_02841 [Mycolicibacterium fluoranthenivorans]|uniref:Uncharacterized protein n=1 Tax=Mycolicibacterium fluoranthenivorans TaxID=258505 RepID=A0A1G4WC02_9MYCO|nr:hypothetical protein SAMN02799620_02841 [Mycolicibacterium fluoranthenivorans]
MTTVTGNPPWRPSFFDISISRHKALKASWLRRAGVRVSRAAASARRWDASGSSGVPGSRGLGTGLAIGFVSAGLLTPGAAQPDSMVFQ